MNVNVMFARIFFFLHLSLSLGRLDHAGLMLARLVLLALSVRPRYDPSLMTEPGMDFDLLQRRIADVKRGISSCRLLVLESMVPGQKLIMTAPPELVELLQSGDASSPIVVLGRQGERPHSHGVSIELESVTPVPVSPVHPEGTADVVISARRLVEVVEVMPHFGNPWFGRPARARWIDVLDSEPAEPAVIERAKALKETVDVWLGLVRRIGSRQISPEELERVLANLGTMPDAEQPSARALWVAGLLQPAGPSVGMAAAAYDVRGAALMAPNAHLRLKAVERAMTDSIKRLGQGA